MSKPSLKSKLKRIADKKAKMETLKTEIESLEAEVQAQIDNKFCVLSKQYFEAVNDEKRGEIEQKIKALMRGEI